MNSSSVPSPRRRLSDRERDLPGGEYPRSRVTPGIVHLGVGGFHRAHQAMFVDATLTSAARTGNADALTWGICGVGLLPQDAVLRDALSQQDLLYTLVTVAPDETETARVIGSIVEYLFAPDDPEAVTSALARPQTRIVSLTITEGGYGVDDSSHEFAPEGDILDDLARADQPGYAPRSAIGHLVAGLAARRDAGLAPFTVMSCDNVRGNGDVARTAVLGFAQRIEAELADWIAQNTSFPNSMVDRITPVMTTETRAAIAETHGIEDAAPVRSESFVQWVLEDRFPLGRPAFEDVGVQLVPDAAPYEAMKLRLLNATHQAIGHLGLLAGRHYVHEVAQDPFFRTFLLGYMRDEALPTLAPVPGIDLDAYCDALLDRFSSIAIRDTLARLVTDASDRIPVFLLPVVRDRLSAGGSITRAALVIAAWSLLIEGRSDEVRDRRLAELRAASDREQHTPGSFLALPDVFGELTNSVELRTAYLSARERILERGVLGALPL